MLAKPEAHGNQGQTVSVISLCMVQQNSPCKFWLSYQQNYNKLGTLLQ